MFKFNRLPTLSIISFLLLAATTGCHETSLPTAPLPPNPPPSQPPTNSNLGSIYGIVMSARDGQCLAGATIEMLDGPRAGERVKQSAADCDSIYDVSVYAFIFRDLPSDRSITLRASMPGYESRTMTVQVVPGCCFFHHSSSINVSLAPAG